MSGWTVVLLVLAAWFVVSVVVGLAIGRVIRSAQSEEYRVRGRGTGSRSVAHPHRAAVPSTNQRRAGKHQARGRGQLAG